MWSGIYLLLLGGVFAANVASNDPSMNHNNIEDNGLLFERLFPMINTIVSETSRLSESQKALTKTLLELIERQEKQETKLAQFIEENKKYLSNLEQGQEKLETKQSEFMEESKKYFSNLKEGHEKLETQLSDFLKRSETSCSNLENWHEKQETQLSEFIKKSETSFSYLEKSITKLSESDESIAFMNSTQNDLMTMKNGLQQQQSKLSYFMDQYLDNNVEWTTVLRRQDGSVDFYRNWNEYQKGFGDPDGEFFIGLDKLHNLTTLGAPQELLIVLKDFDNEKRIARYDKFKIGNADKKYQLLELGTYSGDAGDSLVYHKNQKFSTHDNDNDDNPDLNCAEVFKGAWWFSKCYTSHLFGPYRKDDYGVVWGSWKGKRGLKFAEMKIRSKFN